MAFEQKDAAWYRSMLKRAGWTQKQAAEHLGIDPRTSRRYALGEHPVPAHTAKMLELLVTGQTVDPKSQRPLRPK